MLMGIIIGVGIGSVITALSVWYRLSRKFKQCANCNHFDLYYIDSDFGMASRCLRDNNVTDWHDTCKKWEWIGE